MTDPPATDTLRAAFAFIRYSRQDGEATLGEEKSVDVPETEVEQDSAPAPEEEQYPL